MLTPFAAGNQNREKNGREFVKHRSNFSSHNEHSILGASYFNAGLVDGEISSISKSPTLSCAAGRRGNLKRQDAGYPSAPAKS
jgi:hypothetical protein